jgi:hypothetical protein
MGYMNRIRTLPKPAVTVFEQSSLTRGLQGKGSTSKSEYDSSKSKVGLARSRTRAVFFQGDDVFIPHRQKQSPEAACGPFPAFDVELARDRERAVTQGIACRVDTVRLADQRAELLAQGVQRALGLNALAAQPSCERVKDRVTPVILPLNPFGRAPGRFDDERAALPGVEPAQDLNQLGVDLDVVRISG